MPRLPPALLCRAHSISPHLRTLLPACRDISSARHELRWIREHVRAVDSSPSASVPYHPRRQHVTEEHLVAHLCAQRGSRGEPLQYVLGSQPFGRLDLRCERGVLIPRPETEAYVVYLADLICRGRFPDLDVGGDGLFRVLDLCTGTGCIALLLYEQLRARFSGLQVMGLDVSSRAIGLARVNLERNLRLGFLGDPEAASGDERVSFHEADIFSDEVFHHAPGELDVLISNPPYISTRGFNRDTGRSVRNHEPKLALVPDDRLKATAASLGCELEDVFYARLLEIAEKTKPKVVLFEVGDMEQAERVVKMAMGKMSPDEFGYEIWRDEPDFGEVEVSKLGPGPATVTIRGEGHGRSMLIYRIV